MQAAFRADQRFSKNYAVFRLLGSLAGILKIRSVSRLFHEKKLQFELSYLESAVSELFEKYRGVNDIGAPEPNAPIWVCWWTGFETAPKLIRQCVRSTQKNSGSHPVILLTKDNVSDYIDIPGYITDKVERGKMGLAHLADYIRVAVLYRYGGLWLDATIFCSDAIPESFFELPFFTCKSEYRESAFLSHYEWVTFCLGGWKGNVFYEFMKDAFERYWSQNDYAIDYLFFDDLIYLAKKHVEAIKDLMEAVPLNTPHRDDLQDAFNACLPADAYQSVICDDTPIYKLSWREKYSEITESGEQSIYGFFLSLKI